MQSSEDLDETRRRLAAFARQKRRRTVPSGPGECDWAFGKVQNPTFGAPFTEEAAWHFIADLIEGGHPMNRVPWDDPPNAKVFSLLVDLPCEVTTLYIKVQLGGDRVIGRSFHLSDKKKAKHGTPWKPPMDGNR